MYNFFMDILVNQKVENFFSQFKHQSYKKGEILIRAEEDPSGIFFIQKGTVKQYTISQKGEELVVNIYKPLTFLPMSWAINQTPNKYYFESLEELEVIKAPKEDVVNFLKQNTDVTFDLLSRVYRGLDGVLTKLVALMDGEAHGRLVNELVILAKRFGQGTNFQNIEINSSEKDLANQTGMARETVSREIKILKDKGLVEFNKNQLIIKDLLKLEQELQI